MLDAILPEDERLGSEDPIGALRCPLNTLENLPGLASVVRGREGSTSFPVISRLLETAARRADPLDLPRNVELDNCIMQEPNKKKTIV